MEKGKMYLTKETILVVDDIELNRAIVKKTFADDYKVLQAENGEEALRILRAVDIAAVLLDLQMPVMDGYDVIRAMKADTRLAEIPIIITTAARGKAEHDALKLGADDFVTMPYDPFVIKKRVENLINRYELREMQGALKERLHYHEIFDMLGIAYLEWTDGEEYYRSKKIKEYAISEEPNDNMSDYANVDKYTHPEDAGIAKYIIENIREAKDIEPCVMRCLMKNGSYQYTEILIKINRDKNNMPVHSVLVMRNIDKEWIVQKNQLEAALTQAKEASVAKTEFLSRISHDMRTPLNGILGITNILKNSIEDKKYERDLQELEASGEYLLNLINDTLDVSRIESGKLELHKTVCDGRAVFNNAIMLARASMQGRNINFEVNSGKIPFTMLYIDPSRLQQVILNIVGNAVKFTPDGGTISIKLENISIENGVIKDRIIVKDTGKGMSKEFLPHLFEAFSQEDAGTTSTTQGTGLGMAITKQIISHMGGDIQVESELGKGTTFTVVFCLNIATPQQIEEYKNAQLNTIGNINLAGCRVLLCEDHPLNTKIALKLLESKQIIVDHAENGKVAVDMFANSAENYYDAILMDIRMPVMDGINAAKEIRCMLRGDAKKVPIIAMTANAFNADIEKTKAAGMNAHIAKPINTEVLYSTLTKYISGYKFVHRQKVLIVDDNEVNRTIIKLPLAADYDVLEAENGKRALQIINDNLDINVVITDIQMPEMNGVELIRKIREMPNRQNIVIIANTQFGDANQEEELLDIGANDFIYKPTTPKIVEIRVRNALRKI